jgi:hypothetical protein
MEQIAISDEREEFPSRAELWQGVVLGTIAHAIWMAPDSTYSYGQGWDGPNYLLKDGRGDCAALTFTPERVVGAFFDLHSVRSPFRDVPKLPFGQVYRIEDYFVGAPIEAQALARQEALTYVFDDYEGEAQPVITAACWSEGDLLAAREPWQEVRPVCAHLLNIQTMPPEQAVAAWTEEYEFDDDQVALLRALFDRRMASVHPITVEGNERRTLTARGDEGLAESRALLAAIGIELP